MKILKISGAIIIFVILIAYSIGCDLRPVPASKVVGKYTMTYNTKGVYRGKETLNIKSNGSFEQTFYNSEGIVQFNKGKWKYDPSTSRISFENIITYIDEWGTTMLEKPKKIQFNTSIEYFHGRITIFVYQDPDLYYSRIGD